MRDATYAEELQRPTRDQLFINMAWQAASRSTCLRRHVGAIIVIDKRPVSMGYNGAPPGLPHCLDVGCLEEDRSHGPGWYKKWVRLGDWMGGTKQRPLPDMEDVEEGCQRAVHAEANAIAFAARYGVPTDGATLYSTDSPCQKCAELLLAAGIVRVVYDREYRITEPLDMLKEAGVELERVQSIHIPRKAQTP